MVNFRKDTLGTVSSFFISMNLLVGSEGSVRESPDSPVS
jgi:hypothetical protein